ncbi:SusC/RagA family TonB-linked outer membrane protein [Fulvivirga ulvae]|uniref:SusC/RagA family TonB-linked outer membrane protein n=1 Tax=Fulvivirga ulvae TaxID=2904245 RepID=UPI001F2BE42C|nr:SusC/RagA family TonB-linked outer membrane protein [Fulvivirga ulvae]UII32370.1 SusC/RagA family TonB-linked outer membrane protein [Fulvivirga ulvae]
MKKFLLISFMLVLILGHYESQAQERSITGKVTSVDEGQPLPGVNVVLKGTTTGTVTDIEGNYKLNVPQEGGVLVFSFIGLESQEMQIGSRAVIDVQMASDVTQLSEVVVTAVGIERSKKSLGYSVENVGSEQIQQKSEPDVLKALQGKIPGVQISGSSGSPGSATRITIRGASSFLGNNQPLFVVDGIPYNDTQFDTNNQLTGGAAYANGLAQLDPNNIASISVLKGAAAAALYGSRAANGVIVVTTKSGSARASRKGLEITVSSSFALEEIANLPDYQNTYGNGAEFLYSNSNGSWGPAFASLDSFPTWGNYLNAFPDMPANLPYVAQPDNVKDLFETGTIYDNSISIVGGNEKATLSAVVSHMTQDGYIPFSSFDRSNLSIGGNAQLDNRVIIGGNLSYTRTEQHGPIFGAAAADPTAASSFARTLWLGRTWDTSLPYENPQGGSVFYNTLAVDHPLWSWKHNGLTANVNRLAANFNVAYDITDWLTASFKVGTNTFNDRRQQVWDIGSNAFSGTGAILDDDIFFEEIETNFLLTFQKDLNEDFDIKAIVGHNSNQRTIDRQSTLGTTIVSPGIYDIDNTNTLVPNGGTYSKRRLMGVFGEVNVGYRDFLFLNMTGRNDWSSTLPVESRSFFYPSASLSFIFTEGFDINSTVLTNGKLRASWAKVGNDAGPYSLTNTFSVNLGNNTGVIGSVNQNDLPFLGQPGITQSNVASDPDLTPEFTKEWELGTSLAFFEDRINLDVTYYKRNSTDQIANVTLPSASGFEQLITNFGDLENKGWEIGLGLVPVKLGNGFKWETYTTFTKNESKVLALSDGVERINIRNLFGGGVRPILEVGQPYGALYGSVSARDDEGNFLIDPRTGILFPSLENNGLGIIGDPNPDFTMGFINTFSFKGITLQALIDYRHGGDMYTTTVERLLGRGVTKDTEDRESSRIIPGFYGDPNTGQPLLDESGNKIPNTTQITTNDLFFSNGGSQQSFGINGADEMSVYDGTVIRLREVSLGYQLPKKLLEKTPFGSASITFTGRNLWYNAPNIPEYTNFDPEVNGFGSTNTQGIEYASAPQSKRYGVNLKFTF